MRLTTTAVALPACFTAAQAQSVNDDCTDVHIWTARGSNEPYPGRQQAFIDDLCGQYTGGSCAYSDIIYSVAPQPAGPYCQEVYQGTTSGISALEAYAAKCPSTAIVLSCYSEGCNVMGNILGGSSPGPTVTGCDETPTDPLPYGSAASNNIHAVLLFGNVRHVAGQPYNVGNGSDISSPTPRGAASLAYLNQYSAKMQDYALSDDPYVCGGDDLDAHFVYLDLYAETAAQWVLEHGDLPNSGSKPSTTASSPTSTTVAPPASATPTNGTTWTLHPASGLPSPMPISYSGASIMSQSGFALVSAIAALAAAPFLL